MLYSSICENHIKYVNLVLKYLYLRNLYLKLEKSEFYKKKVNFLGFIVEKIRIQTDSNKISNINNQEILTNIKKL